MVFFCADTHFDHENILQLCNRPFETIEQMNETIIENWNRKITGNDTVYIMGDMFFRSNNIEKLGSDACKNPICRHRLFEEPLECAMQSKRQKVIAKICEVILQWSPFVVGSLHAIELACRTRNLPIFKTYLQLRGVDFLNDPDIIEVILQEDYVELMDFCLKLKLDKRMRLRDGRSLYEAAVSDEMRALLDERLISPSWGDRQTQGGRWE